MQKPRTMEVDDVQYNKYILADEVTMKWQSVGEQPCSVARTLSVMGDRWTMLILRNAFLGIRRFDDFQSSLGVTRHVLAERLKRLVEHGILKKTPYQDRQERFEYRLTEKGRDLQPILLTLTAWGDKWMDEGRGAPVIFHHRDCGHAFTPMVVCSVCKEAVTARNIYSTSRENVEALESKLP